MKNLAHLSYTAVNGTVRGQLGFVRLERNDEATMNDDLKFMELESGCVYLHKELCC